ncbi:MAG: choice-of-anchor X domain-containing protein [Candidatus Promineifilaceae bacterium]
MSRLRAILFLILFTLSLPLLFMQFTRWQTAVAAPEHEETWGINPSVGVVLDTTASMGPELAQFKAAWQAAEPYGTALRPAASGVGINAPTVPVIHWREPLTATLRLVGFRDVAQYFGATTDYDEFAFSMINLPAEGGAGCLDNALAGLATMTQNMPAEKMPASDLLLVTDATPMGNRANFVYVVNRLLQRGVNVHSLVSGWCPGDVVPEKALEFLTLATGGRYYRVTDMSEYYTTTLMAHNRLFSTDLLLSEVGSVTDSQPDMIPIEVDSTMFGLSAETTLGWTGCLTCTRPANTTGALGITAVGGMQFQLIDPDNNVYDASTPYFSQIGTSSRELLSIRQPLTETLQPGTWHLRVTGNGDYAVSFAAQSDLHLAYLGPGSARVGQPMLLRVALGQTHDGVTTQPLTATFKLVSMNGLAADQNIALFDDGLHQDGEAGDGIYGGMVTPATAGWWRVMASGKWTDGSSYQRLAEVPLRVQAVSAKAPAPATSKPNETQLVSFELTNDASGSTTTFELGMFSEQGWVDASGVPANVTLDPGETVTLTANVVVPGSATDGLLEEVTFVAVAANDESVAVSARAEITVEASTVYLPMVVK